MEFWNDQSLWMLGMTAFLITIAIPFLIGNFVVRVLGRSVRKTIRVFRKK